MQVVHALDEIANPLRQATPATHPAQETYTTQFLSCFQITHTLGTPSSSSASCCFQWVKSPMCRCRTPEKDDILAALKYASQILFLTGRKRH